MSDVEDQVVHQDPQKVKFHYVKSNAFRTIHADGIIGSVTPRLTITASFFSERLPIPDQTVQAITPEGKLGGEVADERITREGILREIEVNVVMDVTTAKAMIEWLEDKVKTVEEALSSKSKEVEGTH